MGDIVKYVQKDSNKKITLEKLESFLWKSADILRGSIDSSEYKHYIFGLLFLKRLSDQFQEEYQQIKDDPEDRDNYKFYVPKRARWSTIRKVSEGIGGAIDKAFAALEEENEALQDVLVPIEFGDTKRLKDETLSNLIIHFSQKDFNLANSNLFQFIEDDLIEGVIALPGNLFYNTGSPGCLIIINKNKPDELKEKIFFIHAENEYDEGTGQNFLREKHIKKISDIYQKKKIFEKFSKLVDKEIIIENDYNLNVSRYVDILPDEEPIDINECLKEIDEIRRNRDNLEDQFEFNMRELDYSW